MPHDWAGLGAAPDAVGVLLQEAAVRVREAGWTQGKFRDEESGAIDAVQALADVVGVDLAVAGKKGSRIAVGPAVMLGAALERATARSTMRYLSHWNDMPERTLDEVVGLLEGA